MCVCVIYVVVYQVLCWFIHVFVFVEILKILYVVVCEKKNVAERSDNVGEGKLDRKVDRCCAHVGGVAVG